MIGRGRGRGTRQLITALFVAGAFAELACSNRRTPVPGAACTECAEPDDAGTPLADAPDGGAADGPPTLIERERNDDHSTPTMVPIGATVLANNDNPDDIDCFEVEAPAGDPSGGYFQASLTQVGAGALGFSLYTVSDNGLLYTDPGGSVGQSRFFFWAASPGQRYQIRTMRAAGDSAASFPYTLDVAYQPIADPRESNDTAVTASPITLGSPVTAYLFRGFITTTLGPDQDWYSVHLDPGPVTLTITSVPADIQMALQIYDSNLVLIKTIKGENYGAGGTTTVMVTDPDIYRVRAYALNHAGYKGYGDGTTLPRNFTKAYNLTVSQ